MELHSEARVGSALELAGSVGAGDLGADAALAEDGALPSMQPALHAAGQAPDGAGRAGHAGVLASGSEPAAASAREASPVVAAPLAGVCAASAASASGVAGATGSSSRDVARRAGLAA
jgi:hypothetical protein